eukprot:s58_g16.t1
MTSDGGGTDRRLCLDGSVEDYEDYLQRLHTGLIYVIQEEVNRVPTNGEEGERQGKLLQELKGEMWALEDELKNVGDGGVNNDPDPECLEVDEVFRESWLWLVEDQCQAKLRYHNLVMMGMMVKVMGKMMQEPMGEDPSLRSMGRWSNELFTETLWRRSLWLLCLTVHGEHAIFDFEAMGSENV